MCCIFCIYGLRAVPGKRVLGVERNLKMRVPPTQFYLFLWYRVHMDIPGNTPYPHNFNWFQFHPPMPFFLEQPSVFFQCILIKLDLKLINHERLIKQHIRNVLTIEYIDQRDGNKLCCVFCINDLSIHSIRTRIKTDLLIIK